MSQSTGAIGDLRHVAATLLHQIARGDVVQIEDACALASAVLESPVAVAARAVLEAEEAFVLRRAVELAGYLLETEPVIGSRARSGPP